MFYPGSVQKANRFTKKKEKEQESEDRCTASYAILALQKVNVKSHISALSHLSDDDYYSAIQTNLRQLTARKFDKFVETKRIWEDCMKVCYDKFPRIQSTSRYLNFEKNDNNVNKFFGNTFGSSLHMARYYAGNFFNFLIRSCIINLNLFQKCIISFFCFFDFVFLCCVISVFYFSFFLENVGTNSFESVDDYKCFVEWIIEQQLSSLDQTRWSDEIPLHISRISLHFLKFLSMHFHGNEDDIFEGQKCYSSNWSAPKKPTNDESAKVVHAQNTVLFNLISNSRRENRETINVIGCHVVARMSTTGKLHAEGDFRFFRDTLTYIPMSAYSTHSTDISVVLRGSVPHPPSSYSKYVHLSDEADMEHQYTQTQRKELLHHLEKLPTTYFRRSTGIYTNTDHGIFCGIKIDESDTQEEPECTLQTIVRDDVFQTITTGGGPFVELLAKTGTILTSLSLPFRFLVMVLEQEDEPTTTPILGEFPFEKITKQQFQEMAYKPLVLETRAGVNFNVLSMGDVVSSPTSYNDMFVQYFTHLINADAGKQTPKELIADEDFMERCNFKNASIGEILQRAVRSVLLIYQHKVFEKRNDNN